MSPTSNRNYNSRVATLANMARNECLSTMHGVKGLAPSFSTGPDYDHR